MPGRSDETRRPPDHGDRTRDRNRQGRSRRRAHARIGRPARSCPHFQYHRPRLDRRLDRARDGRLQRRDWRLGVVCRVSQAHRGFPAHPEPGIHCADTTRAVVEPHARRLVSGGLRAVFRRRAGSGLVADQGAAARSLPHREAAHAQFVAVIAERNRIAREIHDTMAQGFAGISVQLEVLNDRLPGAPEKLRRHLDLARELVRTSLDEARRSVWNLRAQALEEAGLAHALSRLDQQLSDGSNVTFELRVDGTPRTLLADVENNLLRIGQEAITNATRHAGAKRVSLTLSYLTDGVCLVVSDDGKGFDPERVRPSSRGGFGLAGIRERAEAIHASLTIIPESAGGTRLELLVPHV
ncbi:MAG: sensor histidine kinase [Opitutus sp.]|nr:sensor histidine kinase [Opitutus sp.]